MLDRWTPEGTGPGRWWRSCSRGAAEEGCLRLSEVERLIDEHKLIRAATLDAIARFGVAEQRIVEHRTRFELVGLTFEAFPVDHSLRAPAVGYRVTSGSSSLFYVPDLVEIRDRADALAGIELYIGDGASLTRGIIRTRDFRSHRPRLNPRAARLVRGRGSAESNLHALRLRARPRRRTNERRARPCVGPCRRRRGDDRPRRPPA